MTTLKDLLDLGISYRKTKGEYISPHKIAVAIFISEYIKIRQEAKKQSLADLNTIEPKYRKDFCVLVVKLIQSPDLKYNDFENLITNGQFNVLPEHILNFKMKMKEICENGISCFMDLNDFLSENIKMNNVNNVFSFNFNKLSVVGFFIRRFTISIEVHSFSEITDIHDNLKTYYMQSQKRLTKILGDIEITDMLNAEPLAQHLDPTRKDGNISTPTVEINQYSRKQAELFIATQAALLEANEESALSPPLLQDRIRNLLLHNPEFAEAHFLSYLNCIRVKEFCGAIDSLYHCFDRSTSLGEGKNSTDEKVRGLRYAALNLAILHAQFGHKEEAMAALKESIMIAQEENDNVCLQHALTWMYKLVNQNKELLIERSIFRSCDLSLSYNMSLGIQSYTQHVGLHGGKPKFILDIMTKSDILNCQHSLFDLLSNSYAQKAALWFLYGKQEVGSLWSQLLLHLKTDHLMRGTVSYNGEGLCQAICNVANIFIAQGEYTKAFCVLHHARERFPNEPLSHIWMFCEKLLHFTQAYHNCFWLKAEIAAHQIATFDETESKLCLAKMFLSKGDYVAANSLVEILLNQCQTDQNIETNTRLQVRAMILRAHIKCTTFAQQKIPSETVMLLNEALSLAKQYFLHYEIAIINLIMANVQLMMGMPSCALKLINKSLITVLAHGSCYDRARTMLLYVKCIVAKAMKIDSPKNQTIFQAALMLDNVAKDFEKVQAYSQLKDVYYLQAILYESCNFIYERNKSAAKFKSCREQYPSACSATTALICLF